MFIIFLRARGVGLVQGIGCTSALKFFFKLEHIFR